MNNVKTLKFLLIVTIAVGAIFAGYSTHLQNQMARDKQAFLQELQSAQSIEEAEVAIVAYANSPVGILAPQKADAGLLGFLKRLFGGGGGKGISEEWNPGDTCSENGLPTIGDGSNCVTRHGHNIRWE